jgi:hypothetical protein
MIPTDTQMTDVSAGKYSLLCQAALSVQPNSSNKLQSPFFLAIRLYWGWQFPSRVGASFTRVTQRAIWIEPDSQQSADKPPFGKESKNGPDARRHVVWLAS